jgi:hypothetical protein
MKIHPDNKIPRYIALGTAITLWAGMVAFTVWSIAHESRCIHEIVKRMEINLQVTGEEN